MAHKFINTETIIGRVYQHDLVIKKVQNENSANYGKDFISGKLDIAVDEDGLNVISVNYTYVSPTYSSGKENTTYKALKKIIDNGKTWVVDGKENATMVRATPSLALNDFDTERDGETVHVAAKKNEGGFLSIINSLPEEHDETGYSQRSKFTTDILITKVKRVEADEERNIPEYVNIHGAVFDFRGSILPVDLVAKTDNAMNYFESLEPTSKEPVFTKVWGTIDCTVIERKITEESAFGEAAVRTIRTGRKEWVVTGAAKVPYDFGDEEVLNAEQVKTKMQDREVYLAEQKKNREEWIAKRNAENGKPKNSGVTVSTDDFDF